MNRKQVFFEIDKAIAKRNPLLAEHLNSGLSKQDHRFKKLMGCIDAVVDWYAWHNGTRHQEIPDGDGIIITLENLALTPESVFCMVDYSRSYNDVVEWKEVGEWNEAIAEVVGRYFPLLWDGGTSWLSVCIDEMKDRHPVGFIDYESDQGFEKAYDSFDEFLLDVLRSNQDGGPLKCFE